MVFYIVTPRNDGDERMQPRNERTNKCNANKRKNISVKKKVKMYVEQSAVVQKYGGS